MYEMAGAEDSCLVKVEVERDHRVDWKIRQGSSDFANLIFASLVPEEGRAPGIRVGFSHRNQVWKMNDF